MVFISLSLIFKLSVTEYIRIRSRPFGLIKSNIAAIFAAILIFNKPKIFDIRSIFESEFLNMTKILVTIEELEDVRERLIKAIHTGLTDEEKQFLLSFKTKSPEWALLGIEGIDQLPAVKWKMLNLEKMPKEKHERALQALKGALDAINS